MALPHPCARSRHRPRIHATLVAAFLATSARAQHPGVTFGPPPDWVVTSPLVDSRPYDAVTQIDGLEHLLLDDQIRTGTVPREHYRRHVYRVLDEKGIRDAAQIEIEFDPSYESVVIHGLAVYRGETEISRATEAEVRVLEREPGLEAHVYDERLSILAILGDVRIGDRIEATYTIRGENPVFGGRYASRSSLGWDVPLRHAVLRILVPKGHVLNVKAVGASADPTVTETGTWREFLWDRTDVPAVVPESGIPPWFDPFPSLELSEFADWSEVGLWGLRLYELPAVPSEQLRAEIDEIARLHAEPDARIVAALAFVRDQIRYLSLALGPQSHRPSLPDVVLQRRFGDCKDKAVLLVALLEGLGLRARPALVSTRTCAHAAECLPSPLAFDHAIVRVEHAGRIFWLDPTNLHARGSLDRLSCPRFGVALVLDDATTALVPIQPAPDDRPGLAIQTSIDACGPGRDARISVESTYSWASADSMRARLGEAGRSALEKGYLDFYARLHPSIRAEGPLEIRDDENANVIVTTERYLVPDFWRLSDDGARLKASIHAPEISELVSTPSTATRTMPLAISYPMNVKCHISARLPGSWELAPVRRRIDTDAVRFACDIHTSGSVVDLDYDYEALQDALPPERALAHVEQVGRILEVTRYDVSMPASRIAKEDAEADEDSRASRRRHWIVISGFAAMAFVLTATISAALFLYRPKGPHEPIDPGDAHLQGIGGWLGLAGIGIVITPFMVLRTLSQTFPVFDPSTWAALTTPGSDRYHERWAPLLLTELFCNIGMFNLSTVLVILFFLKRRAFPGLFMVTRTGWCLFLVFDSFAAHALPHAGPTKPPQYAGAVCATAIWVAYFLKSRRVSATFVR